MTEPGAKQGPMTWQARIANERGQLREHRARMRRFVDGHMYGMVPWRDRCLMRVQLVVMNMYMWILDARLRNEIRD